MVETAGAQSGRSAGWGAKIMLAAASLGLVLLLLEGALALKVLPVSGAAANYVHGCYELTQPRRFIHGSIRPLKLGIHRPSFEADCHSLGHSWRHRSDAFGWRNPETWETADVVLLGDSMVYGHGVEENQTLAHFLRGGLELDVVNLGITGGSPVHYLAYLRNFALPLEPKVVVVFTFGNDLSDIRATRPMSKIRRFIRTGRGREAQVLERSELLAELRYPRHEPSWFDRFAVGRLIEYNVRAARLERRSPVRERATEQRAEGAVSYSGEPKPPPRAVLERQERLFTVRYLKRALEMMSGSAKDSSVALVVAHIGKRTQTDWLLRKVLEEASVEHGFNYFDTPELLGERYRLPRDGHYNEEGHRALAEALAGYLRQQDLVETRGERSESL